MRHPRVPLSLLQACSCRASGQIEGVMLGWVQLKLGVRARVLVRITPLTKPFRRRRQYALSLARGNFVRGDKDSGSISPIGEDDRDTAPPHVDIHICACGLSTCIAISESGFISSK